MTPSFHLHGYHDVTFLRRLCSRDLQDLKALKNQFSYVAIWLRFSYSMILPIRANCHLLGANCMVKRPASL